MVHFVESSKPAAQILRQNLQSLGIAEGFQILEQPSAQAIPYLDRQRIKPDFIFMDPPYQLRNAYPDTLELLGNSTINERALVIVEHEKRFDPGEKFGRLLRVRKLEQGDASLGFYRST